MHESFTPKLEDLDVKGRDIEGLESSPERFSSLEPSVDWKVESVCRDLKSDIEPEKLMLFINPSNGDVSLDVKAPHWRSITHDMLSARLETEEGPEDFYEANVKGCGYLKPTVKGEHSLGEYEDWHRTNEYDALGAYGLADRSEFLNKHGDIIDHTRNLIKHGLRTEMYGAWGKLKNVYYQGKKVSVQELRDQEVIPRSTELVPAIGLRFLKTNTRIAEFTDHDDATAQEILRRAFETFNHETKDKELGLPTISLEDPSTHPVFFKTFFERMGSNLAILNNLGYSDWHLHSSNVTMAAEIADIGTINDAKTVREDEDSKPIAHGLRVGYIKDMRDMAYTLATMLRKAEHLGLTIGDRNELFEVCMQGFNETLEDKAIKKIQKAFADDHRKLFEYVMRRSIIENAPLPSVKKVDPSNWEIE